MFGHKPSAVDRVVQRTPRRLDSVAAGALLLGMGNWLSMSLFNFDAVKAVAGTKGVSGRAAYGALGAAALYGTVRGSRRVAR